MPMQGLYLFFLPDSLQSISQVFKMTGMPMGGQGLNSSVLILQFFLSHFAEMHLQACRSKATADSR